jgi:hypothetical protein
MRATDMRLPRIVRCAHTHTHTHPRAHTRTRTETRAHAHTRTRTHAHTPARHAQTRAHKHAHTSTRTQARAHEQTHARTPHRACCRPEPTWADRPLPFVAQMAGPKREQVGSLLGSLLPLVANLSDTDGRGERDRPGKLYAVVPAPVATPGSRKAATDRPRWGEKPPPLDC